MFTKRNINNKRCNECKKRKKKCQINGDSCSYCLHKGTKCIFQDEILEFNVSKGKLQKKKNNLKLINYHNCNEHNQLLVNQNPPKIPTQINTPLQNKFFCIGHIYPKLFVPSCESVQNTEIPMINDDPTQIDVYNKDMVIFNNFSLSSYVLSSIRIKSIDEKNNIENDRNMLERLANSDLRNEFITFFRKNNISILEAKSKPKDNHIKSIDEINLYIDFNNLKNILMIEEAAITVDSKNRKFINLPHFIDAELANKLFDYFCLTCTEEYTKTPNTKISMLSVCLPLILGNLTILKVVLLYSYYHKLQANKNDESLLKIFFEMKQLHLNTLNELSKRLEFYSSVSCDHSIFCVLLFLNIEIINGARGSLWNKLQILAQSMISIRGGSRELCKTLTGECLMKLLLNLLCTDVNSEGLSVSFGINDFKYVCEYNKENEFYDNVSNKSSWSLMNFKNFTQLYFHVSILKSLMNPSSGLENNYSKNVENLINIDYESICNSNIERIMLEASLLEMDIKSMSFEDYDNPTLNQIQSKFATKACLLFLYQTLYRQAPISPQSLLLLKSLKNDVAIIFEKFKCLLPEDYDKTPFFILPLFCYGVDLVGKENRISFINNLTEIYHMLNREMIKSAIDLVKLVWKMNRNGVNFIDWKYVSETEEIYISFCC